MATKKRSAQQWFYPARGSYLPRTWQAWTLYVLSLVYILAPLGVDLDTSVSGISIIADFITRLLVTGCGLTLIAQKKS